MNRIRALLGLLIPALLSLGHAQDTAAKNAVQYLKSQQGTDGSWSPGGKQTIDTAEATETLAAAPDTASAVASAGSFLAAKTVQGTDGEARKLTGLASAGLDVTNAHAALKADQNVDGSWGAAAGHRGTALDTALAIHALSRRGSLDPATVLRAIPFLASIRTAAGGWSLQEGGAEDPYISALVVSALGDFALATGLSTPELEDNLVKGTAYLLTQANADGSFGSVKKTATTAWSVMALLATSQPAASLGSAVTYLKSVQLGDGSWEGSVHLTALAARALLMNDAPPTKPADLVVNSISFSPATPSAGQTVVATVVVANQGGRHATNFVLSVTVDGAAVGPNFSFEDVGPGGTASVSFTTSFAAGTHTVTATVDPDHRVVESNYANNSLSASLTVGGGALSDEAASSLTAFPSSPLAGDLVTLSVVVQNIGTASAQNVAVAFFDGGKPIGSRVVIPLLAPSASVTASLSASFLAGTHAITAIVDPDNLITEVTKTNNTASLSLAVLPGLSALPDLSSSLAVSSLAPAAGTTVTLTGQVVNVGGLYSNPSVVARFFDGPFQIGDDFPLPGLPTGSAATLAVSASFSPGVHMLTLVADATNSLAEVTKANNVATVFITVGSGDLADLVITFVDASKTSLALNEPVTLFAKVKNIGAATAGSFVVGFYDGTPAGGNAIGTSAVSSLAPGVETLVQIGWVPPSPGTHAIFALADATNRVAESNKGNNLGVGPILTVSTTLFVDPGVLTEEGTDVWLALPPFAQSGFLVLSAENATTYSITGAFTASGAVAPGTPVILTLPDSAKITSIPPAIAAAQAIHVTSSGPIRAHLVVGTIDGTTGGINDTNESTLLLPSPTLGTDYRIASFGGTNFGIGEAGFLVVGTQSDTSVSVQIVGTIPTSLSVTLQPGDVFRFPAAFDLSGSRVTATKPVAVLSYTTGSDTNGPGFGSGSNPNPMLEAMMPADFFGTHHVLGTQLSFAWFRLGRILAHQDGTIVTVKANGSPDSTFTLNAGQFQDVDCSVPAEVYSTKPVAAVRYFNRNVTVAMAWVSPLAAAKMHYRFPTFAQSTFAQTYGVSFGSFVSPLAGTEVRVNGVATPFSNSFEIVRPGLRMASEAFFSPFELGSPATAEVVVDGSRPVHLENYGGGVLINNRLAYLPGYRLAKKPSPVVSSIAPAPGDLFTGTATTVAVGLINLSFADASGVRVQLFDGNVLVGDTTVSSLPREGEGSVTFSWTPSVPGERPLTAVVDPANLLGGVWEGSKSFTRSVHVQAPVQISGSLALSGTTFLGNQNVGIGTMISNLSTNIVQGNFSGAQLQIQIVDASGNVVATLPTVSMTDLAAMPSGLGSWHFALDASVTPTATRNDAAILGSAVNFSSLLAGAGASGTIDGNSIRVFEIVGASFVERPAVFIPSANFTVSGNYSGRVEWNVPGPLAAGATRAFRIFFDTLENGAKPAVDRVVEPAYTDVGTIFWPGLIAPPDFGTTLPANLVLSDRKEGLSLQSVPNDPFILFRTRTTLESAIGDFNGDGYHDVVRTATVDLGQFLRRAVFLLSTGGGNAFVKERPALLSVTTIGERQVRAADLNGDGNLDIAVVMADDLPNPDHTFPGDSIYLRTYLGRGDGTFALKQHQLLWTNGSSLTAPFTNSHPCYHLADVNGDGKLDLILAAQGLGGTSIYVFLGNGDGTFSSTPLISTPFVASSSVGQVGSKEFVAGDFDGSGKVSLVFVPSTVGPGAFLKGNGDGTFQPPVLFTNGGASDFPAVADDARAEVYALDYNRDGKLDLLYLTGPSTNVTIVNGDGTGKFSGATSIALPNMIRGFSGLNLAQAAATPAANAKRTGAFLKDFAFNTDGLLPGSYSVRMTVSAPSGQVLFSQSSSFSIMALSPGTTPASITGSHVQTDKATYAANDTVTITSTAFDLSPSIALTGLTLSLAVTSPTGTTVFTDSKAVATLAAGSSTSFDSKMATGILAPGTYTATLSVSQSGTVLSTDSRTFAIAPTLKFSGTMTVAPNPVVSGGSLTATFSATDLGNVSATGTVASFTIVNPGTTATVKTFSASVGTVAPGATASGTASVATTGILPGTYVVYFQVVAGSSTFTVASAILTVTAPSAPFLAFGIFGDQFVAFSGQGSSNDITLAKKGDVFSNKKVTLSGQAVVNGKIACAGGPGSVTLTGKASVTGTITTTAAAIPLPAPDTLVDSIAMENSNATIGLTAKGKNPLSGTAFTLAAGDSITLGPGKYFFSSFTVNGTLKVSGPVTIALSGGAAIQNSAVVNPTGDASKLLLVEKTAATIAISGKANFTGAIYCPKAPIQATGQGTIKGSLVGFSVTTSGSNTILYDPSVVSWGGVLP